MIKERRGRKEAQRYTEFEMKYVSSFLRRQEFHR